MSDRPLSEVLSIVVQDVTENRGRRVRHGVAWRARRVRNYVRTRLPRRRRPEVTPADLSHIYSVSFGQAGQRVLQQLYDHLGDYGVESMIGGVRRPTARVMHIAVEDIRPLGRCLLDHCADELIKARVKGHWRRDLSPETVEELALREGSFDLMIVERVTGADVPHLQCSRLEIAVWRNHVGPYGKANRESDRTFEIVGRLREPTFNRFRRGRHNFDDDFPAPDAPKFPIDIVYTWVDGDDEAWQAEKDRYTGKESLPGRVQLDERFRSRDELKYSLRSVELFAPWVRRIHIVTADQCPPWLDTAHPKINLVSHRDIYADSSWLPTFNSSSIETQLHHVPGLTSKFLYFNDDFFLGQLCDPVDFFHSNGVIKFFPSDQRAFEEDIDEQSEEYIQADKNAIDLIRQQFPEVGRSIMQHVPYPADRQLLHELEDEYEEAFAICASARFRSRQDIRPIAFMQYHWGYQVGRAMPATISHRYLALWKPTIVQQMTNVAASRSRKAFCINDVGLGADRLAEVNEAVFEFLESYYPDPSSFEL